MTIRGLFRFKRDFGGKLPAYPASSLTTLRWSCAPVPTASAGSSWRAGATWLAFGDECALAVFAGTGRLGTAARGTKANPVEDDHALVGFLTCEPNMEVGIVHATAMPVILRTFEEREAWLNAPVEEALNHSGP